MTQFLRLAFICLLLPSTVFAQQTPVDVSADQALEWHRADGYVVLRGNAVVTRGADKLTAPLITAYLTKGSTNKIERVVAEGGMVLTTADGTATGPSGNYDMTTQKAQLLGSNLQLQTSNAVITANQQMDYDSKAGILVATGAAKFVQDPDTINADVITAHFAPDAAGQNKLVKATGVGHLVLVTPKETLTADKGDYLPQDNKAYVWGNVKIVQGQNTLEGARGEVDLTTNVSTLYGAEGSETGRVKGVFFTD